MCSSSHALYRRGARTPLDDPRGPHRRDGHERRTALHRRRCPCARWREFPPPTPPWRLHRLLPRRSRVRRDHPQARTECPAAVARSPSRSRDRRGPRRRREAAPHSMSDEACRLKSRMSSKLWRGDAMCWSPPRRTLLVRIVRRASSESVLALCGVHRKRRSSLHLDLRARRSAASGPLFRARTYGGVTPSVLPLRTVMTRRPHRHLVDSHEHRSIQ
jgi:hypothetical protein